MRVLLLSVLAVPLIAQDRSQLLVGLATHENAAAGFRVTAPAPWRRVAQERFDLLVEAGSGSSATLGVLQRFVDGGLDELERRVRAESPGVKFEASRDLEGKAGRFRHLHGVTRSTAPHELHVGLYAKGRRGFEVVMRASQREADALRRVASSVLRGFEIVPMRAVAPRLATERIWSGFALRAPADWAVRPIDGGMVAALEGRGALASISVQREALSEPYEQAHARARRELARDAKLADGGAVEVLGRRVTLARFEHDVHGRRVITLWGLAGRPGLYLHVYYTADPEVLDVHQPVALESMRSIRIP